MHLTTIYRKIVGNMKLQLDENTLNAYINEAIRQELKEGYGNPFGAKNTPIKASPLAPENQGRWYGQQIDLTDRLRRGKAWDAEQERKRAAGIRQNPLPISVDLFQYMYNTHYGGHLKIDGIWGPETEKAYQDYVKRGGSLQDYKIQQYAPGPNGPVRINEKTLNAYINEALRLELNENATDELFGSRVRKQSRRMITGQGWGNQKRSENGLLAANSDIQDTDADEVVPQTLVGMIKKMEQGLVSIEQTAGLPGQYEGLGEKVAAYRSGGGFKMKQSLLNAINALARLADRVNAVERKSGSNAIMESAGDYMDAAVAGNAAVGNARNMANLGRLQKTANSANGRYGAATREFNRKLTTKALDKGIDAEKTSIDAMKNLRANNVKLNTGFWGKQVANVKNGAQTVKGGVQTIKGAKNTGNAVQAGVQAYRSATAAGKTAAQASKAAKSAIRGTKAAGQVLKGAGQIAKGVGQISQIPLLLLTIADEAARQGAEARQRKIVRTYNCASVLAKRIANIAQEIADAQGAQQQTEPEQLEEINVKKSRSFFDSIEQGMNELSGLMKQINMQGQTQSQEEEEVEMPSSLNTPEEIRQFQIWANLHEYKDERGMKLDDDGKWGPHTEYVYNQIAQQLGGLQMESRNPLNESNAVMQALTNLENKVGVTGSGGRAYSDISTMSGAKDGSRSQGARSAKFIIRTYPPVLNQYLAVLKNVGADVNGIQPLPEDNRLHRDYDWQEVQAIDSRIKQLLSIAKMVGQQEETPEETNITLPPKPIVRRQNPNTPAVAAPEVPELNNDFEIEDPEIDIPDMEPLDTSQQEPVKTISYPGANGKLDVNKGKNFIDNVIDAMRGFKKNDSLSLQIRKMGIGNAYRNALVIVDRMVQEGSMTREQAIEEKKKLKYYYKQLKNVSKNTIQGNGTATAQAPANEPAQSVVNEATFKKLVKQIIRESFMNK